MSDYRVIAAATQTLQNLLMEAIRETVPGATVQTGPPEAHSADQVGEGLVNLFLYKVEPNKVWRNEELPVRRSDGSVLRRPQLAVDLDFLLSFYGDERRKVPYLLLGLVLSALHAEPYPSVRLMPQEGSGEVRAAGEPDPVSASLAGSGLAVQRHPLRFSPLSLPHDELHALFSQVPFVMSVAYRASVLLIEPALVPEPALPVRRADLHVTDSPGPALTEVEPPRLPYHPAASVTLRGRLPAAEEGKVLFGELAAVPAEAGRGAWSAPLPEGLQAGTHLVRVAEEAAEGGPRRESNPIAFLLEPVVLDARTLPEPPAGAEEGEEGESAAGRRVSVEVRFAPPVTATTPVMVLLNGLVPSGDEAPRGYALEQRVEPTEPDRVRLEAEIATGSYLVRVQIHGVTSRLEVAGEETEAGGRFVGPRLEVGEAA